MQSIGFAAPPHRASKIGPDGGVIGPPGEMIGANRETIGLAGRPIGAIGANISLAGGPIGLADEVIVPNAQWRSLAVRGAVGSWFGGVGNG
jgi:hypothetical protein